MHLYLNERAVPQMRGSYGCIHANQESSSLGAYQSILYICIYSTYTYMQCRYTLTRYIYTFVLFLHVYTYLPTLPMWPNPSTGSPPTFPPLPIFPPPSPRSHPPPFSTPKFPPLHITTLPSVKSLNTSLYTY